MSLKKHGEGEAIRKILEDRYLESVRYVKNATANAERKKFQAVVELFKKYGEKYEIDYLLVAAQGYQESTLDHSARSPVGAIGIMQVMPATGKDMRVGDITKIEANIHAGVKYMRFMMDQYYKDEPMDNLNKALMTFASYNAGPGRLRQLRLLAEKKGLDPNVWFGNVERVASERIGRETVTYVSNIFKYYVAYRLIEDQRQRREAAKAKVATPSRDFSFIDDQNRRHKNLFGIMNMRLRISREALSISLKQRRSLYFPPRYTSFPPIHGLPQRRITLR